MKDQYKIKKQLIDELVHLREYAEKCRDLLESSKGAVSVRELSETRKKLEESGIRLSQIVEGSPVPTFVIDKNHVITHWNKACENLTGIPAHEVIETRKQWSAFYSSKRPVMADLIVDKTRDKGIAKFYGGKYKKSPVIEGAYEAEGFFPALGVGGKWLFFTAASLKGIGGEIIGAIETLQDITERRQAEELYKTLADTSRVGVYIAQDGKFVFVNPYMTEYSGYRTEELVGMNTMNLVHPEDRESVRKDAVEMLKDERKFPYEHRTITRDGRIIWILENITSIDYFGKRAVLGISMDISSEREARIKLEEAEAFESSILAAMPHAVIGLENRKIIFANDAVETVFGWKPEELIGKFTRVLYRSEDECEEIAKLFYPVLEKQRTHREEFPCRRRDGTDIMCMISTAVIGAALTERKIVVVYEDITERKQAEDTIRESEEKYSAVVEQAMYGVVIVKDEKYMFANKAMAKVIGYSVEEISGMPFLDIFAPECRKMVDQRYKRRMAGGRVLPLYETKIVCKDGTFKDVEVAFGIIKIAGTSADMGYVRDITVRKKAQEELKETVERLQKRLEETVNALASMTEKRDPYTAGHSERVTQLACAIAKEMDLTYEQRDGIKVAGTLHDIGKIYEPSEILSKPGILSDIEMLMMRVHPEVGYDILKTIDFPWPVAQIVRQHHERIDGSGYPDGLKDDEILIEAKIMAVSDVVDAMASHRPYRPALGIDAALEEISKNRGILYDSKVVDTCLKLFKEKKFKFQVDPDSQFHLHYKA